MKHIILHKPINQIWIVEPPKWEFKEGDRGKLFPTVVAPVGARRTGSLPSIHHFSGSETMGCCPVQWMGHRARERLNYNSCWVKVTFIIVALTPDNYKSKQVVAPIIIKTGLQLLTSSRTFTTQLLSLSILRIRILSSRSNHRS